MAHDNDMFDFERSHCIREHRIPIYNEFEDWGTIKNGSRTYELGSASSNWFAIFLAVNIVPGLAENIPCSFTLV